MLMKNIFLLPLCLFIISCSSGIVKNESNNETYKSSRIVNPYYKEKEKPKKKITRKKNIAISRSSSYIDQRGTKYYLKYNEKSKGIIYRAKNGHIKNTPWFVKHFGRKYKSWSKERRNDFRFCSYYTSMPCYHKLSKKGIFPMGKYPSGVVLKLTGYGDIYNLEKRKTYNEHGIPKEKFIPNTSYSADMKIENIYLKKFGSRATIEFYLDKCGGKESVLYIHNKSSKIYEKIIKNGEYANCKKIAEYYLSSDYWVQDKHSYKFYYSKSNNKLHMNNLLFFKNDIFTLKNSFILQEKRKYREKLIKNVIKHSLKKKAKK